MFKVGVVMNPISEINYFKDSTLLLMIELQEQGHELFYICLLYTSPSPRD